MNENKKLTGYHYQKAWFDFAFENPDVVSPSHTAMYLWFVELNNRMGWAEKFASPASQTMAAIGLKSYNTYKKVMNELIGFGFIKVVTASSNQYTACIIALSNIDKAQYKALDKAVTKHCTKQGESTVQSIDSVIKGETVNNETVNEETLNNRPSLIVTGAEKELFMPCKNSFLEFYLEQFKTDYYFTAMDGGKLKSILKKIVKKTKEKSSGQKEKFEIEDIRLSFKWFYTQSYEFGGNWLQSNFSLKNLDTQFNEIYSTIRDGKSAATKKTGSGAYQKSATNEGIIAKILSSGN
jgi:hypothetical protein